MEIWTNSSLPIDDVLDIESRMKGEGILVELGGKKGAKTEIVKRKETEE